MRIPKTYWLLAIIRYNGYMITNYIIAQNGRIINRISDTFENAVAIADKFADTHKGDWTAVYTATPRKQVFIRCDEAGVREIQ